MGRSMMKPKNLKKGDKVTFVSLSRGMLGEAFVMHKYELAKKRLEEEYGLQVVEMPNALKGNEYLYEHPEARAEDLMEAFKNPEIKAIFSAIGGDDTIRLLPYIDFEVIQKNPKIFTGYSDTTVNHFMMRKAGLVSYYGLSVLNNLSEYVAINEYTKEAMEKTLFTPQDTLTIPCSEYCSYDTDKVWWDEKNMNLATPRFPNTGYEILQGTGKVTGELLGGCVETFPFMMGTDLWPSREEWRGKLLLLEVCETDKPEMALWIIRNLQTQGILDVINGIVFGKPATADTMETYKEILKKVVSTEAKRPDLPILYNVNVGHAYPIGVFPLGLMYEIDCEKKIFRLLEPATVL